MNIIDYILIGIVFIFCLTGFMSGLLWQLTSLLGILIGLAAGFFFFFRTGNLFLSIAATVIAGLALKLVFSGIKKMYNGLQGERKPVHILSRLAGGLLGGLKGLGLVFLLLFGAYLFSGVLLDRIKPDLKPVISEKLQNSFFYSQLQKSDQLFEKDIIRNIYFAGKVFAEGFKQNSPETDKIRRDLEKSHTFQAALNDSELQQAIQDQDFKAIMSNPAFINLLKDKEFLKKILSLDYETIYNNSR